MRIAMIGQKGIFVVRNGGIEKHVEDLSLRLAKLGHEVFVYSRPHYMPENLQKSTTYKGIHFILKSSIKTKYLDTISHVFVCTLHALFQKYDIIHFHGVGPSLLAFLPRLFKPKAKVVVTFHSIDRFHKKWGSFARRILEFGEWTSCKYPHKTIVVSKTLQKYCKERYNKETVYIPNGITIKEVVPDHILQKWNLEREKYILTVARFIKHKGIHYLIQAFNELAQNSQIKNWKLAIVGDAPYPDPYKKMITKLAETNPNIIFTGYQTKEALAQLFSNAYLYVHPSEFEGLSITILEAMGYGRCVLCSNIPENLEAIGNFGFSFKNKDVKDLKNKLLELISKPELVKDIGIKAKEYIKKNYNWDNIVKKTEEFYQSLVKK
jgi:glycosyltransferase involved in cell wall biosynthesis